MSTFQTDDLAFLIQRARMGLPQAVSSDPAMQARIDERTVAMSIPQNLIDQQIKIAGIHGIARTEDEVRLAMAREKINGGQFMQEGTGPQTASLAQQLARVPQTFGEGLGELPMGVGGLMGLSAEWLERAGAPGVAGVSDTIYGALEDERRQDRVRRQYQEGVGQGRGAIDQASNLVGSMAPQLAAAGAGTGMGLAARFGAGQGAGAIQQAGMGALLGQAAGSTNIDIKEGREARGQEDSLTTRTMGALGSAAVEYVSERAGLGVAGEIASPRLAEIGRRLMGGRADEAVRLAADSIGLSLANAPEEAVAELGNNLIVRLTYNPEQQLTEGLGGAALGGAMMGPAFAAARVAGEMSAQMTPMSAQMSVPGQADPHADLAGMIEAARGARDGRSVPDAARPGVVPSESDSRGPSPDEQRPQPTTDVQGNPGRGGQADEGLGAAGVLPQPVVPARTGAGEGSGQPTSPVAQPPAVLGVLPQGAPGAAPGTSPDAARPDGGSGVTDGNAADTKNLRGPAGAGQPVRGPDVPLPQEQRRPGEGAGTQPVDQGDSGRAEARELDGHRVGDVVSVPVLPPGVEQADSRDVTWSAGRVAGFTDDGLVRVRSGDGRVHEVHPDNLKNRKRKGRQEAEAPKDAAPNRVVANQWFFDGLAGDTLERRYKETISILNQGAKAKPTDSEALIAGRAKARGTYVGDLANLARSYFKRGEYTASMSKELSGNLTADEFKLVTDYATNGVWGAADNQEDLSKSGQPNLSASSGLVGRPLTATEGSLTGVGTQDLEGLSQTSDRTGPLSVPVTRTSDPLYTEGPPRTKELGERESDTGRIVAQRLTGGDTNAQLDEGIAMAAQHQGTLDTLLSEATADVGGLDFNKSRQKLKARLIEKVAEGKPPHTISDYLAARILIDELDSVEALKEDITQRGFKIIEDDDFLEHGKPKKGGHRARNLQVVLGDGFSAEVQLVTRETYAIRKQTHELYEIMRDKNTTGEDYLAAQTEAIRLNDEAWAKFMARQTDRAPAPSVEPSLPDILKQEANRADRQDQPGPRAPSQPAQGEGDQSGQGQDQRGPGAGGNADGSERAEAGGQPDRPAAPAGDQRPGSAVRADDGSDAQQGARPGRGDRGSRGGDSDTGSGRDTGPVDFVITPETELVRRGQMAQIDDNLDALELLKKLEAEDRPATPEEQAVLARFSGWNRTFKALEEPPDPSKAKTDKERERAEKLQRQYGNRYRRVRAVMTDEEYKSARRSATNAEYTPRDIALAMLEEVQSRGFRPETISEPASGSGLFFGLLPEKWRSARKFGVELDELSARLVKKLYPSVRLQNEGYQRVRYEADSFDLTITNVPFADVKITDSLDKQISGMSLHDYYIAKMIRTTRPGGIVMAITSRYSMDKVNSKPRKTWQEIGGDFLGAVRLPGDAFGSSVVTDILVFQKNGSEFGAKAVKYIETSKREVGGHEHTTNSYFAANPSKVLGVEDSTGKMRAENQYNVSAYEDTDLAALVREQLGDILVKAAQAGFDAVGTRTRAIDRKTVERERADDAGDTIAPNQGNVGVRDGNLVQRLDGELVVIEEGLPKATADRVNAWSKVRDLSNQLRAMQIRVDADPEQMKLVRQQLGKTYDAAAKKYGFLHNPANRRAMSADHDLSRILALEIPTYETYQTKGKTPQTRQRVKSVKKADIFTKRTQQAREPILHAETPTDALNASLGERGRLDEAYIAGLLGIDESQVEEKMAGLAYRDPADGALVESALYLSGNVRRKLAQAKQAAESDPRYLVNVRALEENQPEDLEASDITANIGATWIDVADYQAFFRSMFGTGIDLTHLSDGTWHMKAQGTTPRMTGGEFGTEDVPGNKLFDKLMNKRDIVVKRRIDKDTEVVDQEATALARAAGENMKRRFEEWIWEDADRAGRLLETYNRDFNNSVPVEYDGSYLRFPGMSTKWTERFAEKGREYRTAAVYRAIAHGNTLFAHNVGAGKTSTIAATIMERKRLGLSKKQVLVVPNPVIYQWPVEFSEMYPDAKILAATSDDFSPRNRQTLMNRIATGDWDVIILPSTSFEKIPMSPARVEAFFQKQIDALEADIIKAKAAKNDNRSYMKELENRLENFKEKLRDKAAEHKKDQGPFFDELGIDGLYVDEAHEYKNLFFRTTQTRVAGIQPGTTQRSFDMLAKTEFINELTGHRGVFFATGTPVTNTMGEVYTMTRYLRPDLLGERGMEDFDPWSTAFGEVVSDVEVTPEGKGFRVNSRFKKFINLPELQQLFRTFADVRTAKQINLARPEIKGGKPKIVDVDGGVGLEKYVEGLVARAEAIRGGNVDPSEDNMLAVVGEGRKAALDLRLVGLAEQPASKLDKAADEIARIYRETSEYSGAQIVWSDLGTPKGAGGKAVEGEFDVYNDLKQRLVDRGLPADEVRFIHEATNDVKKRNMYADMRSGKIRVMIASTAKMGVGANVQERLAAMHHLDAPWRPADLEQREGRILRPGNLHIDWDKPVEILNYITKKSFDAYMWQTLETKSNFIEGFMSGDAVGRTMEDLGGQAMTYAEMKAAASDNPKLMEFVKLDRDVKELEVRRKGHLSAQIRARQVVRNTPEQIKSVEAEGVRYRADAKTAGEAPETFGMRVGKTDHEKHKEAGEALIDELAKAKQRGYQKARQTIGSYRGLDIVVAWPTATAADMLVGLEGEALYTTEPSFDPVGIVRRVQNLAEKPREWAEAATQRIASLNEAMKVAEEKAARAFPAEQELVTKRRDLMKLQSVMQESDDLIAGAKNQIRYLAENKPKGFAALAKSRGVEPTGDIARDTEAVFNSVEPGTFQEFIGQLKPFEAMGARANPNTVITEAGRLEQRTPTAADFRKQRREDFRFKDGDTERGWQLSKGRDKTSLRQRVIDGVNELRNDLARGTQRGSVPQLARRKFGLARHKIKNLRLVSQRASTDAIETLKRITEPLDDQAYDIFTRYVYMLDFKQTASEGKALPFGFTDESVEAEVARLEAVIDRSYPEVRVAHQMRSRAWQLIKEQMLDAAGRMSPSYRDTLAQRYSREHYMHHEILEHVGLQRMAARGGGATIGKKRAHDKQRKGSTKAINTEYAQAEFRVMALMLADTYAMRELAPIGNRYDIYEKVKAEAKARRDAGEDITWQQVATEKEGYRIYMIRPGRVFFMVNTVPEQIAEAMLEDDALSVGLRPEDIGTALAMGGNYKPWIIPNEVADALDNYQIKHRQELWAKGPRRALNFWKAQRLGLNPLGAHHWIKYRFRNQSEFEKMVTINPSAMKKMPEALAGLRQFLKGDPAAPREVREWARRGGIRGQQRYVELGEAVTIKVLDSISVEEQVRGRPFRVRGIPQRLWQGYENKVGGLNDLLEGWFRYATYLDYLDQMQNGGRKGNAPRNFGSSVPAEIMDNPDLRDRAYHLSNDIFVPYDDASPVDDTLRRYWMPFWMFQSGNFRAYWQAAKNLASDPQLSGKAGTEVIARLRARGVLKAGVVLTPFAIRSAGRLALLFGFAQMATFAWNQLMMALMDDDELVEDLPTQARRSPTIVFGRTPDGRVVYFNRLGTSGDFLDWFGLDSVPMDLADLLDGRRTLDEVLSDSLKSPVNKVASGLGPHVKTPIEMFAGAELFPDAFKPRLIRDTGDYLAKQLDVQGLYRKVTSRPRRPIRDTLGNIVAYYSDPEAVAYSNSMDLVHRFRTREGLGSGFHRSAKGNALYWFRLSLRYGDEQAAQKWATEYFMRGGTGDGMRQSLRMLHPLGGLSAENRAKFLSTLRTDELNELMEAADYYEGTLIGTEGDLLKRVLDRVVQESTEDIKKAREGSVARPPSGR